MTLNQTPRSRQLGAWGVLGLALLAGTLIAILGRSRGDPGAVRDGTAPSRDVTVLDAPHPTAPVAPLAPSPTPAPPRSPDTEEISQQGWVVRADNQEPLAGVALFAMPPDSPAAPNESALAKAVSLSDGQFTLNLKAGVPVDIVATMAGFRLTSIRVQVPGKSRIRVAMSRGASVSGKVTSEDGAPISGVELFAMGIGSSIDIVAGRLLPGTGSQVADYGVASSGSDGNFSIDGLVEGNQYVIQARKLGWALTKDRLWGMRALAPLTDVSILLIPVYECEIEVVDARSTRPVFRPTIEFNAAYSIAPFGLTEPQGGAGRPPDGLTSDGKIVMRWLRAGPSEPSNPEAREVNLFVSALGYESASTRVHLRRVGEATGATRVTLQPRAEAFGELLLTITAPDGSPFVGPASLGLRWEDGFKAELAWLEVRDGVARIGTVPAGRAELFALAESESRHFDGEFDRLPFDIAPGRETIVRLALKRSETRARLIVEVKDDAGMVLPATRVEVASPRKPSYTVIRPSDDPVVMGLHRHVFTLPPGKVRVSATRVGYDPFSVEIELIGGQEHVTSAVLQRRKEK